MYARQKKISLQIQTQGEKKLMFGFRLLNRRRDKLLGLFGVHDMIDTK